MSQKLIYRVQARVDFDVEIDAGASGSTSRSIVVNSVFDGLREDPRIIGEVNVEITRSRFVPRETWPYCANEEES